MVECIVRQAAIDSLLGWAAQLTETYGKNDEYVKCLESAADNIEQIPAADVRPNVRGEWISPDGISTCSVCGKAAPFDVEADIIMYWPNLNFCPNCGADMREETTNGN